MDEAKLAAVLEQVFRGFLPAGWQTMQVSITHDDPELERAGNGAACFFGTAIPVTEWPKRKKAHTRNGSAATGPDALQLNRAVKEALAGHHEVRLISVQVVCYSERSGIAESVGYRVYLKCI